MAEMVKSSVSAEQNEAADESKEKCDSRREIDLRVAAFIWFGQ